MGSKPMAGFETHGWERQGWVSEGCLVFFVLKLMSASYPLLPAVSLPRWFKGVGVRSTARKVRMGSKPMIGRGRAGCLKKGALREHATKKLLHTLISAVG